MDVEEEEGSCAGFGLVESIFIGVVGFFGAAATTATGAAADGMEEEGPFGFGLLRLIIGAAADFSLGTSVSFATAAAADGATDGGDLLATGLFADAAGGGCFNTSPPPVCGLLVLAGASNNEDDGFGKWEEAAAAAATSALMFPMLPLGATAADGGAAGGTVLPLLLAVGLVGLLVLFMVL